jgi:hypothetical protein
MKPRVSVSLSPTSVGDDDDANDAEEEDSVDHSPAAQWDGTLLRSIRRAKGAMALDLDSESG